MHWLVDSLKKLPGIEGSSVGGALKLLRKLRKWRHFLTRKTRKLVGNMTVLFIDQAVWWFQSFFSFFFHRLRTLTECLFLHVWNSMQLNLTVNSQPQSGRESIFSKGGTCLVFGTSQISSWSRSRQIVLWYIYGKAMKDSLSTSIEEIIRPQLHGLGYPKPPSSRVIQGELTFHVFFYKIQPTVYITLRSRLGQAGQLGGGGGGGGETTFPHVSTLSRRPDTRQLEQKMRTHAMTKMFTAVFFPVVRHFVK